MRFMGSVLYLEHMNNISIRVKYIKGIKRMTFLLIKQESDRIKERGRQGRVRDVVNNKVRRLASMNVSLKKGQSESWLITPTHEADNPQ
jgi:hypothetical protein